MKHYHDGENRVLNGNKNKPGDNLYISHVAAYQVLISQDRDDLEFTAERPIAKYERWCLNVNATETKYVRGSRR